MKQLLPEQLDLADLATFEADLGRPAPPGRPWVVCNMITSADGATDLGGRSGPLGGPADKAVFSALRGVADVILVGAGTVRQERYRPPAVAPPVAARRRSRHQAERPRLAVVTATGTLDPSLPLFDGPGAGPLVLTTTDGAQRCAQLAERGAQVVVLGSELVDLGQALAWLGDAGARVVLCEGGPKLNGQLIAADLVDEWRLTLSPLLASGRSPRAAVGPPTPDPSRFLLDRVLTSGDLLFVRLLRPDSGGQPS